MIEILDAVSGEKILRFEGRLLASRFDPRREAREWLSRHPEFLDKVRTIIVLGMASGHHVAELVQQTRAKILVIETNEHILEAVQKLHHFPADRVVFEQVKNARGLRASALVKKAVAESFVVLSHPTTVLIDPKVYEDCRQQLLGRDWGALNWQWKIRGSLNFDATPRIDSKDEPLTIYDLEQTELVQSSEEREKLLFKALRELVK